MAASYEIDADHRIVYSLATGTVTDEDLREHQESLTVDPRFDSSYRQVYDLSGAVQIDLTSQGIWRLAHDSPWGKDARRAIVVSSELAFGFARMFQILADGSGEVKIFRDREEARRWLDLEDRESE